MPQGQPERALYIAKGNLEVSGRYYNAGQMLVFARGQEPVIHARQKSTVMLLGGEPLGERFIWWNFVSSRKERIEQAKEDWKAGRIILPPADNKEFVPLPEAAGRPVSSNPPEPEPLS